MLLLLLLRPLLLLLLLLFGVSKAVAALAVSSPSPPLLAVVETAGIESLCSSSLSSSPSPSSSSEELFESEAPLLELFVPLCFRAKCRSQFDLVVNSNGHFEHWNGFCPVCVSKCRRKDEVQGKRRVQCGHEICKNIITKSVP